MQVNLIHDDLQGRADMLRVSFTDLFMDATPR